MSYQPIPAPGYTKANGKRAPRKEWGDKVLCQIRNGWCDPAPWPVATTVWIWKPDRNGEYTFMGDVVAVKRLEE